MEDSVSAVKVEKFVIAIGEKMVELTPSQAKELHGILNELFGPPAAEVHWKKFFEDLEAKREKQYVPCPYPVPVQPFPITPYRYWEVLCNTPKTTCDPFTTFQITRKA